LIAKSDDTRAHQEMRYPNVTWRIILHDYLFTTELRHTCIYISCLCGIPEYFWNNAYISNGRRFTKSALRVLLLSTFRESSINYSFVCSLPIHTRSPTNVDGPPAHFTVSRNRVKCCINVRQIAFEKACNRWMTLKVIQGHCRCCQLIGHIRFHISLPL